MDESCRKCRGTRNQAGTAAAQKNLPRLAAAGEQRPA